jgi:chromosome segregation ATPase
MDAQSFDITQIAGGAAAVVTGIASAILVTRKKLSNDSVELTKDRAEENIIAVLERQRDQAYLENDKLRDRLDKAVNEKDEALSKVSDLTREVENLSGQVRILKELVERLGVSLDTTRQQLERYIAENSKLVTQLEQEHHLNHE